MKAPAWYTLHNVYVAYAVIMGVGGLMFAIFGPMWLPHGGTVGMESTIRLMGFLFLVMAFSGLAMAAAGDPGDERLGLNWFIGANWIVWIAMSNTPKAVWDGRIWFAIWFGLFFALVSFQRQELPESPIQTLFGTKRKPSTARLRSAYEQQIREAAGQEERNRLARDLHDSIKQQIFVMQTSAATAEVRFENDPEGTRAAIQAMRTAAREAMTEMEAMLDQLRAAPLEKLGLVVALKQQCEALQFRTGCKMKVDIGELPPTEAFVPGTHQAILRVAQEALANVGKHARARNVTVTLGTVGSNVELRVEDDGAGYDVDRAHLGMGLANMRGRAEEFQGTLDMVSTPGSGTSVMLAIPFIDLAARRRQRWLLRCVAASVGVLVTILIWIVLRSR